MIPHIRQADGQIGFSWVTPDGRPVTLPELIASDPEPTRLVPTHLSALLAIRARMALGRAGPVPFAGQRVFRS